MVAGAGHGDANLLPLRPGAAGTSHDDANLLPPCPGAIETSHDDVDLLPPCSQARLELVIVMSTFSSLVISDGIDLLPL